MKTLIIENDDEKFTAIKKTITDFLMDADFSTERAETTAEATKLIYQHRFDLIVIDLMMPQRKGDIDEDISDEIINIIEDSNINTCTAAVALSAFTDLVEPARQKFARAGIVFVHYESDKTDWRDNLVNVVRKLNNNTIFDFVVICALEKERQAYHQTDAIVGETLNIRGMDCMLMQIQDRKGVCIKPPRMGLVDTSVISARALECFKPSVIAMSGICAGVVDESTTGQLVVADMCWEYQSGKWTEDGFEMEPYSIQLRNNIKTKISQFAGNEENSKKLFEGLSCANFHGQEILIAPMSSGSAVIANAEQMKKIGGQQRKMAALEMEMYGVYKAAELSNLDPIFFGAKAVADMGGKGKSNEYQEYGAALSARFVVNFISST